MVNRAPRNFDRIQGRVAFGAHSVYVQAIDNIFQLGLSGHVIFVFWDVVGVFIEIGRQPPPFFRYVGSVVEVALFELILRHRSLFDRVLSVVFLEGNGLGFELQFGFSFPVVCVVASGLSLDMLQVLVEIHACRFLDVDEELLSVGSNLGPRSGSDELLNLLPVFAVHFERIDKPLFLLGRPPAHFTAFRVLD